MRRHMHTRLGLRNVLVNQVHSFLGASLFLRSVGSRRTRRYWPMTSEMPMQPMQQYPMQQMQMTSPQMPMQPMQPIILLHKEGDNTDLSSVVLLNTISRHWSTACWKRGCDASRKNVISLSQVLPACIRAEWNGNGASPLH